MRLVTVDDAGRARGGAVTDGAIASLERWGFASVEELVVAGPDAWADVATAVSHAVGDWPADSPLSSPITKPPRNMFCIGLNYQSHHEEGQRQGSSMPEFPIVFTKPWTSINSPGGDIVVDPEVTQKADWEAELAVVIGKGGADIPEAEAMDHVFGYLLANDVSARDLQMANGPSSQWHKGKSLDGFCPLGPYLVTADSMTDIAALRIVLTVNGVVKQDYVVGDMYHPIPKLIAYLSQGMALLPGDVILTGTAAGVGVWREPPEFLHDGDVVEITAPGLGTLSNVVVERRGTT
jgi:2-keto-4-pentenoate hydratase/2-oxohepta-3-ene-1,7-dioic acid hydratase in catechol pathway